MNSTVTAKTDTLNTCAIHPEGSEMSGTEEFCFGCPADKPCQASFSNNH